LLLAYSQILDNVSMRNMEEWVKHTTIPEILDMENAQHLFISVDLN